MGACSLVVRAGHVYGLINNVAWIRLMCYDRLIDSDIQFSTPPILV